MAKPPFFYNELAYHFWQAWGLALFISTEHIFFTQYSAQSTTCSII